MWVVVMALNAGAAGIEIDVAQGNGVVVKASDDAVHIPACRGVTWSLFNAETGDFRPAHAPGCGALESAIRVDAEGQFFPVDAQLPPLPDVGFHILRPTVVYGLKCKEKAPFPMASCAFIGTVDGPQIAVRNRGAAVPVAPAKR